MHCVQIPMPYLNKEDYKKQQREYRRIHKDELAVKAAKKRSANRVEGRYCECSRPAVLIRAGMPWCQVCLDLDKQQKEWNDELKYGISGRVEAARATRKHYHQSTSNWEKEYV